MSSDLSRTLTEAAAEALRRSGFVDPDDDTMPTFFPIDSGMAEQGARMDVWKPAECAAEAAVAAVLETLAAGATHFSDSLTLHKHQREALRRLAAEVSAVPDGQ